MQLTRRRLLRTTGALSATALAGCTAPSDGETTTTPAYEHLQRTAVYVADDVGLRLPERVPTVDARNNADLLVLHGAPAVDADQVVTWLADGRVVALLGDSAEQTWLGWTQTEAYRDAFGADARSDADPDPHLLVAVAAETEVTTHRTSWGELPSNAEILQALEESLADFETWTPHSDCCKSFRYRPPDSGRSNR